MDIIDNERGSRLAEWDVQTMAWHRLRDRPFYLAFPPVSPRTHQSRIMLGIRFETSHVPGAGMHLSHDILNFRPYPSLMRL